MILQLDPPIPVTTPRGKGYAVGWIDYGADMDLYWIVAQSGDADVGCGPGECWIWPNSKIRFQSNITLGRA